MRRAAIHAIAGAFAHIIIILYARLSPKHNTMIITVKYKETTYKIKHYNYNYSNDNDYNKYEQCATDWGFVHREGYAYMGLQIESVKLLESESLPTCGALV